MDKMETYRSEFKVYASGVVRDGIGAYCYIVLETIKPDICSFLRAKFVQAGQADDKMRMCMRAIYEGVRHCPNDICVTVFTEYPEAAAFLDNARGRDDNFDIAERYRKHIADHSVLPFFRGVEAYIDNDFPCNNHDEWVWYSRALCEDSIKQHLKKQQTTL